MVGSMPASREDWGIGGLRGSGSSSARSARRSLTELNCVALVGWVNRVLSSKPQMHHQITREMLACVGSPGHHRGKRSLPELLEACGASHLEPCDWSISTMRRKRRRRRRKRKRKRRKRSIMCLKIIPCSRRHWY